MSTRRERGRVMVLSLGLLWAAGCGQLRFAPSEVQKQNAYLHQRTVQAAALQARMEQVSQMLQQLTGRAAEQSTAILAYYGLPRETPASTSVPELLSETNAALTAQANQEAMARPDPWGAADNLLELGIALAGLVGGAYGVRAVRFLQEARQKSQALREIIQGNELFKQSNPQAVEAFKGAQQEQSPATRQIVAALK